jgi:hypothetical protein
MKRPHESPFIFVQKYWKMADRVQAKSKAIETCVFHSGLIKILVMEELRKKNIDWDQFITSAHLQLNVSPTPQSKVQSPLQVENIVHIETSRKSKRKDIAKNDEDPKEKKEGDIITLHKGIFHPIQLQKQQKLHQLEPQAQKEEGYSSPHQLLQLKLNLGGPSPGLLLRKKVLKNNT